MTAPPLPPRHPGGLLLGSGPEALGDPLAFYARAQRELGDVVRFRGAPGLRWFLVSHPRDVEHVLRGNQRNYRKPGRFTGPVRAVIGRGLLANEGESWLRQRRLMQPVFHRGRLDGFVRQMTDAAESAAARWTSTPAPAPRWTSPRRCCGPPWRSWEPPCSPPTSAAARTGWERRWGGSWRTSTGGSTCR